MRRSLPRMRGTTAKPRRNWIARRTCSRSNTSTRHPRFRSKSKTRRRTFATAVNNFRKTSTTPAFANRCSRNPTTHATQNGNEQKEMIMKTNLLFRTLATAVTGLTVVVVFGPMSNANAESGYVAHEWGTFTSVQGSDGVQLDWQAQQLSELPRFVYDWSKAGLFRADLITK